MTNALPDLGNVQPELDKQPVRHMGKGAIAAYVFSYFALYVALITPVMSTLALKVNSISGPADRAGDLGLVMGVGAFVAFVMNPLTGALSDRTTSRMGMRKPWLLGGVVLGIVGLLGIAFAPNIWLVVLGWALAQGAFNAVQAALQAILPDQVAEALRGRVSGLLGIAQNVAPLLGIAIAFGMSARGVDLVWMILVPAAIGLAGVLLFCVVLQDRHRDAGTVEPFRLGAFLKNFWLSPRAYPDFAWAFLGRFLLLYGFAFVTTYQIFFMLDRFGFDEPTALSWQLRLSLLQTLLVVVSAAVGGFLTDKAGRRKIFVIASSALAGIGLLIWAFAPTPEMLYAGTVFMGLGVGTYFAVDLALVTDVLPNRETDAAKNMGVFNIANALPQSLAPATAPLFLSIASATSQNYTALFVIGAISVLLGAVSTMFIRGVR